MPHLNNKMNNEIAALYLPMKSFFVLVALTFGLTATGYGASPCVGTNFNTPTNFTIPLNAQAMAVADFNNDGKPDLATSDGRNPGRVSVLLGNGTGGFAASMNFPGGRVAKSIVAGDLNSDGNIDLVLGNSDLSQSPIFSVLLGNGNGTFGAAVNLNPGGVGSGSESSSRVIAIADFNGDAKLDLVATNPSLNAISISLGNGLGGLTFHSYFAAGGFWPSYVTVKDFNSDGKLDLAVANSASNDVSILLGDGAGNFGSPITRAVGTNPRWLVARDFNSDNKIDLAVANSGSNNISILHGDGAGNLSTATNYTSNESSPESILEGDFDDDGRIDLAVLSRSSGNPSLILRTVIIFSADTAGNFRAVANFHHNLLAPNAIVTGDFNADGRTDIAAANSLARVVSLMLNTCAQVSAPTVTQFTHDAFSGFEGDLVSAAIAVVVRTGDVSSASSVSYNISDETASASRDYTPVSGTLNFAPGEVFKTITVPITKDTIAEDVETAELSLGNVTGASSLGSLSKARLLIFDDDAPTLSTQENTERAIALDSVTQVSGPFPLLNPFNFSSDKRTRVSLFLANLELSPNAAPSVIKVSAEDAQGKTFTLPIEYVSTVPGFTWLTQVVFKLPEDVSAPGNLWITIRLGGAPSNRVFIQIAAP